MNLKTRIARATAGILLAFMAACGGGGGPKSYTVTATAGSGGSVSPASATVTEGTTTSISITLNEGYEIAEVTGCGGTLTGTTYTTGPVSATCAINATFRLKKYTVTATATLGGTVTPASATIEHGSRAIFTLAAAAAYKISSATGCGGALAGTTFTTGPITAACVVDAVFRVAPHFVEVPNAFPDMASTYNYDDSSMPNQPPGEVLGAAAVDMVGDGRKNLVLVVSKMRGPGIQPLPNRSRVLVFRLGDDEKFYDITSSVIPAGSAFEGSAGSPTVSDVNGDGILDLLFAANQDDGRTLPGSFFGAQSQALLSTPDRKFKLVGFGDASRDWFVISVGQATDGRTFVTQGGTQTYAFSGTTVAPSSVVLPYMWFTTVFLPSSSSKRTIGIITGSVYPYSYGRRAYLRGNDGSWVPAGEILSPYPIEGPFRFSASHLGSSEYSSYVMNNNGTYLLGELFGHALSGGCTISLAPSASPQSLFLMESQTLNGFVPGQLYDLKNMKNFNKIIGAKIENGWLVESTPQIIEEYTSSPKRDLLCVDVNSDNYEDIVIHRGVPGSQDASPLIYLNDQRGGFYRSKYYQYVSMTSDEPSISLEFSVVGDFNGDGLVDIVIYPDDPINGTKPGTTKLFKGVRTLD